ncbi:MAG: mechanosensitive ion channel family protein [Cyanobacteria bacterium P01_D01_bin.123]
MDRSDVPRAKLPSSGMMFRKLRKKLNLAMTAYLSEVRLRRRIVASVLILLMALFYGFQVLILPAFSVDTPLAPPDTSSPQDTIQSFIENVDRAHQIVTAAYAEYLKEPGLFPSASVKEQVAPGIIRFDRARDCLDTSMVPPRLERDVAIEGTILLKEIFDRIDIPLYNQIPDDKAVGEDKEFTRWTIPNTEISLVKIDKGNRAGEFLFSSDTIARLEEFYEKVKTLPYKPNATEGFYQFYISNPGQILSSKWIQNLPNWLKVIFWGQALWQWFSVGVVLLIAFLIPYQVLNWNWRRTSKVEPPQRTWETIIPPLVTIICLIVVNYLLDGVINITGNILYGSLVILECLLWSIVAITVFLIGNSVAETIIAFPRINSQGFDASMIRTVSRLLSFAIGSTTLIVGIERVGVSLIPILAGLGIGGLALALAARPTLENIIAGVILLVDRPVKVGERCRFGEREGIIQEVGLRSTRIRALDGDLISMPNSRFSELELTNRSRRSCMLLQQTLGLRYDTTRKQLKVVLSQLRDMILLDTRLLEMKGSEREARVRFVKYNNYSLDIEIFVYVDTVSFPDFLRIQEDILLQVKDIVQEAGTDFAFPTQTTYLARDRGLNRDSSEELQDNEG